MWTSGGGAGVIGRIKTSFNNMGLGSFCGWCGGGGGLLASMVVLSSWLRPVGVMGKMSRLNLKVVKDDRDTHEGCAIVARREEKKREWGKYKKRNKKRQD